MSKKIKPRQKQRARAGGASRRQVLGNLAATGLAASLGGGPALAAGKDFDGRLADAIRNVVVIYAENRSFNNLFAGFRPQIDVERGENGRNVVDRRRGRAEEMTIGTVDVRKQGSNGQRAVAKLRIRHRPAPRDAAGSGREDIVENSGALRARRGLGNARGRHTSGCT